MSDWEETRQLSTVWFNGSQVDPDSQFLEELIGGDEALFRLRARVTIGRPL